MAGHSGSLAATGNSEVLKGINGDFSYRLAFTRTTGTLEWEIGHTEEGRPTFSLTGTWTGTVNVERALGRGGSNLNFTAMPNESYTANDSRVLE